MRTETIEIDESFGKEYAGKYVFSEISWARRNKIVDKYTKFDPLTGQPTKVDNLSLQAEIIMASLRTQPDSRPLSFQRLLDESDLGLPYAFVEKIGQIVNQLNGITQQSLRFLLERLDEESRIQLLQSLGYAKNSDGPSQNSENSQQKK